VFVVLTVAWTMSMKALFPTFQYSSPVAVSPLSHLEMNFCIGKEHSFRALRNECQANLYALVAHQ
jgi:hypothetical protein